nr:TPA_asm: hypothetical protein HUJ06_018840 [Nelumbo nucifera]
MMGKNTLTSTNNSSSSSISINDNIQFNSTPSHPVCPTKAEIVDYDFSSFLINTNSATQPLSTGGGYGQNVGSNSNRLVSDPTHFSLPGLMEPSEFGTSTNNSYSVSSSQEFSGLSVSSSLGMDNSYGSWSGNGGDGDENGFLMDLGFGVPYDLLNLFGFQEENSDVLTPNLAKSPYTHLLANVCETKPQGLYQSVTHY